MTRRAILTGVSSVMCCVLTGCGIADPQPPNSREVESAMQIVIGERDGSVNAKGRYRGPRVRNVSELKCTFANKQEGTFRCSFKYDYVVKRNKEPMKDEKIFGKVKVKVQERGKEVEKSEWRVMS